MKKLILLLSIISLFCQSLAAQTGGLNFQGVARNATGAVLANQKINLKFSILKTTETGTVEYTETKEVTTNAQGIFAVVVGEVNATSFAAVDWKVTPKFLKVEMDAAGGTSFITMGTTRLQNVPFAYYANGVNANNIDGAVPVSKGGTGATDAATARTNLGLVIGTNVQSPLTAGTDYLTPTGNAATATKLASAKKINGVDFDGSANITVSADASTLSGTVTVAKGGTGTSTLSGLVVGNGSNAMSGLTGSVTGETLTWNNTSNNWQLTGNSNLAIGKGAGIQGQGINSLAIGTNAGAAMQNDKSIALGNSAGNFSQSNSSIAIGDNAASTYQGNNAVAIGTNAGKNNQQRGSISIGADAGSTGQGIAAISIGPSSGMSSQRINAISIGNSAGADSQGESSIAIGAGTAMTRQGFQAVAIGTGAGLNEQGANSIAIGSSAGHDSQSSNSIIINASGSVLNSPNPGLYVKPIRLNNSSSGSILQYNTTTSEIFSSNILTSATISDKLIVGSSTPTTTSAILEANSTTKGFLPPRMTLTQRNNISSPALGLVIFCTDCSKYGELEVFDGSNNWRNLLGEISSANLSYHFIRNGIYTFNGESWTQTAIDFPSNFSTTTYFGQINGKSYFRVLDNSTFKIWSFDGSSFTLSGLNNPSGVGYYTYLGVINNKIYFSVWNGVSTYVLYSFNGTIFTELQSTYVPNGLGLSYYIGTINNKLYFNMNDGNNTFTVYSFDGYNFTNSNVSNIPPIGKNNLLGVLNNISYFKAPNGSNGYNVYTFNGTAFNTIQTNLPSVGIEGYIGIINNKIYFNASDGYTIYSFDGNLFTQILNTNTPQSIGGWLDYVYGGTLIWNQ